MKCIIQRVSEASVNVNNNIVGEIENGFLILLGIEANDSEEDLHKILKKIIEMRIFPNDDGKFDHSLIDIIID